MLVLLDDCDCEGLGHSISSHRAYWGGVHSASFDRVCQPNRQRGFSTGADKLTSGPYTLVRHPIYTSSCDGIVRR